MDRVSVFIVGLCLAGMVSGEDERIRAVIGDDVTLPCEAKEHLPFEVVEWSRPGAKKEFILVLEKNQKVPNQISERYQGRVKLQDPQNGNVSLDLKNVTDEDKGTYECYVLKESKRRKRAIDPVSTVSLDVHYPSPPDVHHPSPPDVHHPSPPDVLTPSGGANIGLIVGLLAVVALVAAVVAAFVLKKQRSSPPPPDKEAEKPLQIPPTAADPSST